MCFRDECKAQVYKFSGPIYKKFSSKSEAENFIRSNSDTTTSTSIIPIQKKQKFILTPQPGCTSSKRQFSSSSDSDDEIISTNHKKQKNHHPLVFISFTSLLIILYTYSNMH